ncbi:hypothetical protein ZWY2020_031649 [Hordeum vulgare]|nr:hypothetical protein ZWY2020_031649 [Hordeum vulgare]
MVDRWYHADPWVTAQSVNGGVYWNLNVTDLERHPRCLLRFDLDDEALSVTHLPSDLSGLGIDNGNKDAKQFNLSMLDGELCLTGYPVNDTSDMHRLMMVWTLVEDRASSVWEPCYTLYDMNLCHAIALGMVMGRVWAGMAFFWPNPYP